MLYWLSFSSMYHTVCGTALFYRSLHFIPIKKVICRYLTFCKKGGAIWCKLEGRNEKGFFQLYLSSYVVCKSSK